MSKLQTPTEENSTICSTRTQDMALMVAPTRTFPPMHLYVPLNNAQQEIEAHKQHTTQAFRNYTEAMAQSVNKYKYDMEHLLTLHIQETSALLTTALEVNASLQACITQQQAQHAQKIAQLEAQIAVEEMNAFRRYMSSSHKSTADGADRANLDLWDETHGGACSVQSINDFMQLPMFDEALWHKNT